MNTDLAKSFLHLPFQYRKFVTGNRWPLTYQSGRTGCRWYCQGRPSKLWPPVSHGEEEHLDMSIICYATWPIISMFLVASVMITYRVMYFLTHQSHQCYLRDVLTSIIPPVCYCKKYRFTLLADLVLNLWMNTPSLLTWFGFYRYIPSYTTHPKIKKYKFKRTSFS